ncbi:MAG: Gfo/Idh/MocA family oxidoreductase [Anaerolineae bacterium]|nr:Gfo/Idh/MocA family oxidoreductase [Anaerolineae bacterium]
MRTAVIGAGAMGRRHLQAARALGLELVGLADQRADALAAVGAEYGLGSDQQFSDAQTLLDSVRPECLIIATTTPSHAPYTVAAAEAGVRHILCEKPMADSLAACDQMIASCQSHGTRLAINHQMRFTESYQQIKALLEGEQLGGLTSLSVIGGNFGMAMNATHMFELLRYLTNEPPVEVTAWFSDVPVANPRGEQFQDRAGSLRATTASGVRLYIDAGDDQGHGLTLVFAARRGQLVFNLLSGHLTLSARKAEFRERPTTQYGLPQDDQQFEFGAPNVVLSTQRVLQALIAGEGYPSGEEGRLPIMALVAAYLSAEAGSRPIPVTSAALPVERVFPWA